MNSQIEYRVSAPLTRSQRALMETMAREGEAARSKLMAMAGVQPGGAPNQVSIQLHEDYKHLRRMGLAMQRSEGSARWVLTGLGRQIAAAMFGIQPVPDGN